MENYLDFVGRVEWLLYWEKLEVWMEQKSRPVGTDDLEMENERLGEGIQMVEGEKEHLVVDL